MSTTFTNLLYHIVFSTKNRLPMIVDSVQDPLYGYIGGIVRNEGGVLLEIGGMPDHVHLLTRFKADQAPATMLRLIKSNSSGWINKQSGARAKFGWQVGYAAFSVSESQVGRVRKYIRNQPAHHRRKSFKEEFVELLRKHRIEFDERYIWD